MKAFQYNQYFPGERSRQIAGGFYGKGYNNLIDHDNKWIWLMIPKNANTTIKHALAVDGKFLPLTVDVDKFPDYKRITFVRNPFDRLASCYKDKIQTNLHQPYVQYRHLHIRQAMSFKEFIEVVCRSIPDEIADKHFRSQAARLDDNLPPDFIGHVETLHEDWATLQHWNTSLQPLPKQPMNVTEGEVPWNDNLHDMVRVRFAEDFSRYGYE